MDHGPADPVPAFEAWLNSNGAGTLAPGSFLQLEVIVDLAFNYLIERAKS